MKHVYRLSIILGISFLGELLNRWIPLPIPASIYGLVLMLAGLISGIIPLESVRGTGRFLIEIMPVMFIPAAVGLMESFGLLLPSLGAYLAIMAVSTFAVMAVAGRVTQAVIRRQSAKEAHRDA